MPLFVTVMQWTNRLWRMQSEDQHEQVYLTLTIHTLPALALQRSISGRLQPGS